MVMRNGVLISCVLALVANLMVPQQITTYRACCYDEAGKLLPCARNTCEGCGCSKQNDAKRKCCDPIQVQLRSSPPADVNSVASIAKIQPQAQAIIVAAQVAIEPLIGADGT